MKKFIVIILIAGLTIISCGSPESFNNAKSEETKRIKLLIKSCSDSNALCIINETSEFCYQLYQQCNNTIYRDLE